MQRPIVWVHGDCLRPTNPSLEAYPAAPALFVFDDALLEAYQISLKRIVFMYECLLELPVTIRRGDMATELLAFAEMHNATRIITTDSPSPHFAAVCKALRKTLPVEVLDEPPFLDYDGELDLGRFSRYWRVAQRFVS
ncbi:MAG: hypothetical protein SF123_05350 [Chloroflexota bacterium]|nr:hypothetical protein [Chloroflexota bacterium]